MFETRITPRVSETDGAGHVNNVFVPVWFEAGRREIFRILTPDLTFRRWRVALVSMNVDYLDQIYFHEVALVRTWIFTRASVKAASSRFATTRSSSLAPRG